MAPSKPYNFCRKRFSLKCLVFERKGVYGWSRTPFMFHIFLFLSAKEKECYSPWCTSCPTVQDQLMGFLKTTWDLNHNLSMLQFMLYNSFLIQFFLWLKVKTIKCVNMLNYRIQELIILIIISRIKKQHLVRFIMI